MKEATSNKKAIKRIVSSVLALAVALCMCMVAMPMRVLADSTDFRIGADGQITVGNTGDNTNGSGWTEQAFDASKFSFDTATKTFTIRANLGGGNIKCSILKVEGNCQLGTSIADGFTFDTTGPAKIVMAAGATLTIHEACKLTVNGTQYNTLADAMAANAITIEGGAVSGNTITSNTDPGTDPGTDPKTPDTGTVKVGDEVQEPDKTPKESPTYKVVSTDEDNRTVTYEKPAENASGKETVKATVTLADKKEYKVTGIGEGAFANFGGKDNITGIVISDSVEEIGAGACKDCKNLESVKIGSGVKKIGANAFAGCAALTTADLTDNVEEIGASAFSDCAKLKSLTIGKKVKKIGAKAYYNCSGLKNIKVKSTYLTKKSKVGKKAFFKINKKAKVKVKMSKGDAKKFKVKTIKVFKNKSIGYVKTWKVS
ncbi:leucine-rich repeat domain-containing protein [Butyrivibrio sp. AD3002]|uniref:leucine-rich repeat domain-containing protein n=1 Tax=Butyrivibrio sp. AD3002 TaxID=1280670 RepID=UPI0003B6C101|nr:leucine-rich repeat domain-containing protein [Butyrivibrio sp. AD3002]